MSHIIGWAALAASMVSLGLAIWARRGIKADRARVEAAQAGLRAELARAPESNVRPPG